MIRWPIRQAARILRQGGVIAYPTETVYGLGCDPFSEPAVQRLLAIKRRSVSKGLILIISNLRQVVEIIDTSSGVDSVLKVPCLHPTTWVVRAKSNAPPWITGGRSTLAIRVSAHPVVKALCELNDSPLVSSSANVFACATPRHVSVLRKKMGKYVDAIVQGSVNMAVKPSRIRDAYSKKILRN